MTERERLIAALQKPSDELRYTVARDIAHSRGREDVQLGYLADADAALCVIAQYLAALPLPEPQEASGWRHKKRGKTYRVIGEATVQAAPAFPLSDDASVTVYQSDDDGSLWVRATSEFHDGRFEEIPASPAAAPPAEPQEARSDTPRQKIPAVLCDAILNEDEGFCPEAKMGLRLPRQPAATPAEPPAERHLTPDEQRIMKQALLKSTRIERAQPRSEWAAVNAANEREQAEVEAFLDDVDAALATRHVDPPPGAIEQAAQDPTAALAEPKGEQDGIDHSGDRDRPHRHEAANEARKSSAGSDAVDKITADPPPGPSAPIALVRGLCPNDFGQGPCDYPECRDSMCEWWQKADAFVQAYDVAVSTRESAAYRAGLAAARERIAGVAIPYGDPGISQAERIRHTQRCIIAEIDALLREGPGQ